MILYNQLDNKILSKSIDAAGISRMLREVIDTVITADNLLVSTKGTRNYVDTCKVLNSIFMDYLKDENDVFKNVTADDSITIPVKDVIYRIKRTIKNMVIISENDGSASGAIMEEYSNDLKYLHAMMSDFK